MIPSACGGRICRCSPRPRCAPVTCSWHRPPSGCWRAARATSCVMPVPMRRCPGRATQPVDLLWCPPKRGPAPGVRGLALLGQARPVLGVGVKGAGFRSCATQRPGSCGVAHGQFRCPAPVAEYRCPQCIGMAAQRDRHGTCRANSTWVFVGLTLSGKGQVWARDFKFEEVSRDTPVTTPAAIQF